MKNPISSQSRKRIIRLSKHLKGFIKPFPRYGKAINAVVLLGFVMLVVAGAAALTFHNKPTPITTSPTSSADGTNCLLGNSGCSDSKSSSTPTPTTQPAQTTTPSTPSTTTAQKPDSSNTTVTCQTNVIPYTTTTQYVPNEYSTYTYDEGGFNGSKMVCSDGTSEIITPPDNKVIYVGAIDKAAQDLAAYNQIVAYCRSNNPSGGEITTCVDENLVTYDGYAAYPNNPATEAFLNTLQ